MIILLGAPGSGKGTVAQLITERHAYVHLSTGALFRKEIEQHTELGSRIKSYLDHGNLAPDDLTIELVEQYLEHNNYNDKIILDGFPRTLVQAKLFDALLVDKRISVDYVIEIEVDSQTIKQRLAGRRTCPDCQEVYNISERPVPEQIKCQRCGSLLLQRYDDREDVIVKRLKVYNDLTSPLIEYYRSQGKLIVVNNNGSLDDIIKSVETKVRLS